MPAIPACPEPQQLRHLLLGELPEPEAERLEQHLAECKRCDETLDTLKAEDTMVEAIRARAAAGDDPERHLVQELIARVRKLRPPDASSDTHGDLPAASGQPIVEALTLPPTGPPEAQSGAGPQELYDFLAPPQRPDELGRLGHYRVLKLLGAGGMGSVFLAEDPQLERQVALKVMKPVLAVSESASKRFVREARATAAIENDHIVTIHQVGEDRGVPFIAMQFLHGETLEDRLQRIESDRRAGGVSPLMPVPEVLRIGREIAEGLAAAHDRGLMHRDIKPANIWLESRLQPVGVSALPAAMPPKGGTPTRVKIVDFGLARAASGESSNLTQQGAIIGTPAYMAPEQANAQALDPRCDLFSLGCVLYRMTTGELPFKGSTPLDTLLAVIDHTPKPPRELNPQLPEGVERLVLKLLEKDPAKRLPSAHKVIEIITAMEQKLAEVQAKPAAPRVKTTRPASDAPARVPGVERSEPPVSLPTGPDKLGARRLDPIRVKLSVSRVLAGSLTQQATRPQVSNSFSPSARPWPRGETRPQQGVTLNLMRMGARRLDPSHPAGAGEPSKPRAPAGVAGKPAAPALPLTIARFKRWVPLTAAVAMLLLAGVFFAPQIIRIVTNKGVIVVEAADKDVELSVKGDALTIRDQETDQTYQLKIGRQNIPAGDYWLEVTSDAGLDVDTPEFKITRNGKQVVKVSLEKAVSGTSTAQSQPSTGWHGWPADAPPPAIAPFDAATAQRHQEAWAKYLKIDVEFTNSLGMKFRLIPPGEFKMGSTLAEIAEIEEALMHVGEDKRWQQFIESEGPKHKVILTEPIYLGVHEVTQADYEKVMGKNPSYFATTGPDKASVEKVAGMDTTSHPVEGVSWNDAAEFCVKLSQQEKLKPFYFRAGETVTPLDGTGYRLPSEAEWEFACRAGTTTKYWIGDKDEELVRAGWFGTNGGRTHAVGELKGNPFGLYDIHGNVWEWVQDRWKPTYYGQFQEMAAINPDGPFSAGSPRVHRGGDWHDNASYCRASYRNAIDATFRINLIGFRVSLVWGVSRVAGKDTATSTTSDRDRRAAEWVLSIGGNIKIKENGQERQTGAVGDLPRGAFELTVGDLNSNPKVSDAGLAHFKDCKNLTWLVLSNTHVSDAGVAHFKDCKNLMVLHLGGTQVSDA
ncbi:MAG: SUMF1/EgtB/PvdO family nonheme iron enzyme, partial [Planctomycetes bacterium]|nr:SUMF1/EgtB/PvdO family nonheme iron enzyme [Planctomycetota bacterium]